MTLPEHGRPPEILVLRFSSLGDVVLASAVLHALARSNPSAKITFATKSTYQPLFENFSAPIRIVPYQPNQKILEYRKELVPVRYDHIVDLHGSIRSVMLSYSLRAFHRARIKKHAAARRAMVRRKVRLDAPLSALGAYMEALRSLNVSIADADPCLSFSNAELQRISGLKCDSPDSVGVGWGAHWPAKQVPAHVWNGVLSRLDRTNTLELRLFGMGSDRSAMEQFAREVSGKLPRIEARIECGLGLREVMVKLASCAVFVGSDSGLMHLAGAVGVPSFGIFGPTHPSIGFAPAGPGGRTFHAGTYCSPCHRHGAAPCFRERRFCFDELNLDEIAAAIDAVRSPGGAAKRGASGG